MSKPFAPGFDGADRAIDDVTEQGVVAERRAPSRLPSAGTLLGGRYQIEAVIGSGGGGVVLRAQDALSGQPVALKMPPKSGPGSEAGFDREARVLAALDHPGIVRFIDQGRSQDGAPFIVMELLTGETLRERLAHGRLSSRDACSLVARLLDALAFAHSRGIVHRDVKPSNVFLCDRNLERAKLLDFGVAREADGWNRTLTGQIMGTPLYMAPEQARGAREIDGRADIFSLGCMLVECITGRPVFAGPGVAPLAKVAMGSDVVGDSALAGVPTSLTGIVRRMLARDPADRPGHAGLLAVELRRLLDTGDLAAPADPVIPTALGAQEARSLMVLMVGAETAGSGKRGLSQEPTDGQDAETAQAIVQAYGGEIHRLLSGAWLVTFGISGGMAEHVIRVGRAALELRTLLPRRPMALTLGRATLDRRALVGTAIDESSRLVALDAKGRRARALPLRVDGRTADLLAGRFKVEPLRQAGGSTAYVLRGELHAFDAPRLVLGRSVPFVGRDRESSSLRALVREAFEEPSARAVLVIAPAGGGKSRLRHEVMADLGRSELAFEQLLGQGDAQKPGAPYSLIANALRSGAGVQAAMPAAEQRLRLGAMLDRMAGGWPKHPPSERHRVEAFLGHAAGLPPGDPEWPLLAAARAEPRLMADHVRLAWLDFVDAALARQPLALIWEDVHWGDSPSLALLDASLRIHARRPLFVWALARPEVDDVFPLLWKDRQVERVTLGALRAQACREVARAVAPSVEAARLNQVVERSGGNPFFLEELLRADVEASEGNPMAERAVPHTVLAAVQARLDAVADEGKRVLRAASIYGETFARAGVAALIDGALVSDLSGWLESLERRELIARSREEDEATPALAVERWGFRHALVKDAAYDTVTDADRRLGHRLAAEFLSANGERDAMILARHYEKAAENVRAAQQWRLAAEQALAAFDPVGALERCAHARRLAADDELAVVSLIEAKAYGWRGQWPAAEAAARAACLDLRRQKSQRRGALVDATCQLVIALGQQQKHEEFVHAFSDLERLRERPMPSRLWLGALLRTVAYFGEIPGGDVDHAQALLAEFADLEHGPDLALRGLWRSARGRLFQRQGDLLAVLADNETSARDLDEAGDLHESCVKLNNAVSLLCQLGRLEEAERRGQELLTLARRIDHGFIVPFALVNLACVRLSGGDRRGAAQVAEEAIALAKPQGDSRLEGFARLLQAQAALIDEDVDRARALADRALITLADTPEFLLVAEAAVARALFLSKKFAEGRIYAESALASLHRQGSVEHGEFLVWLAAIEAAQSSGDALTARARAEAAAASLNRQLNLLMDDQQRRAVLAAIPEYQALASRGRQLGVVFPDLVPELPQPDSLRPGGARVRRLSGRR